MDKSQDSAAEQKRESESGATGIGTGKKAGIYGCGFLVLAIMIIFIILVLTGYYAPFQGTEGVGP